MIQYFLQLTYFTLNDQKRCSHDTSFVETKEMTTVLTVNCVPLSFICNSGGTFGLFRALSTMKLEGF